MKKMMMLAALLAMLIVAAIPAIAQVENDLEQEGESGAVEQSFTVTNEGSNGNQCVGINGLSNTGNNQTQTGMIQYASDVEEIEQEELGNNLSVTSEGVSTECTQTVNQAAAAG